MKRFLFLLLFIAAVPVVFAALPDKELVVKTSNGAASYALKNLRRITFNDGAMLVDMKDGSTFCWNTDWVNCVTLKDDEAGLETGVADAVLSTSFVVKDNQLRVVCAACARVQLCAIDGNIFFDDMCSGELSFDMNLLPSGIYILTLDGRTYKILNR